MQEVLQPYFTAAFLARHRDEALRAVDADRTVPQCLQCLQIAAGTAAEVEQHEWWRAADVLEKRRDVLTDVMILRPDAKRTGVAVVVLMGVIGLRR